MAYTVYGAEGKRESSEDSEKGKGSEDALVRKELKIGRVKGGKVLDFF